MFKKLRRLELSKTEKRILLELARTSIAAKLNGDPRPKFDCHSRRLNEIQGAFVTLRKNDKLRGCIGLIAGIKPLYQTVQDAAEAAAFEDPRFSPLKEKELEETRIEISVISPLKKISSINKIRVTRDGVLIRKGEAQGLLLPQVAEKNHWDRKAFLEHVCLKAGLASDDWQNPETEIMTFRAQVFEETPPLNEF